MRGSGNLFYLDSFHSVGQLQVDVTPVLYATDFVNEHGIGRAIEEDNRRLFPQKARHGNQMSWRARLTNHLHLSQIVSI